MNKVIIEDIDIVNKLFFIDYHSRSWYIIKLVDIDVNINKVEYGLDDILYHKTSTKLYDKDTIRHESYSDYEKGEKIILYFDNEEDAFYFKLKYC